jgi:tetratricopeptide (TPR) repeat protein
LRTALQWLLAQHEIEMASCLLGSAWRYFSMLNIWDETESWINRTLEQTRQLKSPARAKILWGMYWLTSRQNDHNKSWAWAEEGLLLARELKDQRLIGLLLQCMASELRYRKRYDEALQAVEESLQIFRELGDREEVAWSLSHHSSLLSQQGDFVTGQKLLEESLSIFRTVGNDWAVEQVLRNLALLLLEKGALDQAKTVLEESLRLSEKLGKRMGTAWALNLQGRLAVQQSDWEMARKLFNDAGAIFEKLGDQHSLADNREWLKRLSSLEEETTD